MTILTKTQKRFDLIFFALLFAASIFLSFDLMYKEGKPTTPGVFYSDKSHYYVYLPATFIYGWDAEKFPEKVDTVFRGFVLDKVSNKVIIKVTSGVAILCTPFFLVTQGIALVLGIETTGFSDYYQKAGLIPPIFYFILGLWFLKRFLDHYFKRYISYLVVLIVAAGTNLYYYALVEGWMSHIFSFFLFSALLYLLKWFIDSGMGSFRRFILIALVVSIAVLIRPTNILLLLWLALLDVSTLKQIWQRILFFLRPKYSLTFLAIGVMVFIPQFLYWYYLSGSLVYYSYPGEGFIFWENPMIFEVWFAQLNGLFVYNPLVFFMVAGMIYMIVKKIPNGWFLFFFFLLNSYVIGSWHAWFFGGSYGSRPFAEFFALFAMAFAYLFSRLLEIRNLFLRFSMFFLIFLSVLFNQRMIYNPTWNISSTWAWDDFRNYLDLKNILHFEKNSYTYREDFENITFDITVNKTKVSYRSATMSCMVYKAYPYACHFVRPLNQILDHDIRKINITYHINPFLRDTCGAVLVYMLMNEKGEPLLYKTTPVDKPGSKRGAWTAVTASIDVPFWFNDSGYSFACYLWNLKQTTFLVDDIEIRFE